LRLEQGDRCVEIAIALLDARYMFLHDVRTGRLTFADQPSLLKGESENVLFHLVAHSTS
jgi:hypothetical protein